MRNQIHTEDVPGIDDDTDLFDPEQKAARASRSVKSAFDKRFTSSDPNHWGPKGWLIKQVSMETGISEAKVRRYHAEWANGRGEQR